MSDTEPRNPVSAPQMLADALLRSVAGTSALLRVTSTNTDTSQSELGILATTFYDVVVSPVAMRRLRPSWESDNTMRWELLVSASSVAVQVQNLQLDSAQALFALTLLITVAGQDYVILSVSASEAFGQVYLYRLLVQEARVQNI